MDVSRLSDLAVAANVSSWWVNVNQFGNESLGVKWRANERWLDMIEVRLPLDYSMMSEDRVMAIPSDILEFISEAAEIFTEKVRDYVPPDTSVMPRTVRSLNKAMRDNATRSDRISEMLEKD